MYTLYYLNKNLQIQTIKIASLDLPILIPEDLIFCDLRKGINFIKEPHECIDFTDIERLFMQSEFNDIQLIKDADYRLQNTYLTPLCPIDGIPLILDSVTISSIDWNYPTPVNVQQSTDGENFSRYDDDKMNTVENDNYYPHCWFRLHDKVRNIYSNIVEYSKPS